jgi:ATP-dependent RNA helicase DDX3X
MFSATFPYSIQRLASDFLFEYLFLTVGRVGAASQNVTQKILLVQEDEKEEKLFEILEGSRNQRVLIFVQMKRGADILDNTLRAKGFPVTAIHGDLKQWEREEALKAFKSGTSAALPYLFITFIVYFIIIIIICLLVYIFSHNQEAEPHYRG